MTAVESFKQIPTYLNENCFQKALEKLYPQNCIKLKNWNWQLANKIGDNFNSNIYRVHGTFEIFSTTSYPNVGHLKNFNFIIKDVDMEIAEMGTNETIMLERILPGMMRLLEQASKTELSRTSNKLSANCYWTQSNKEHEFYILEDLNTLGYELGSRYEGFNLQEAKLVLEKLAKFHAVSIIYAREHPDVIASLNAARFANDDDNDEIGVALRKKNLENAIKILKNTEAEIDDEMKQFITNFDQKIKDIVNPAYSAFNVLNHGDIWVNNMLLKIQPGKEDVILIDFENSFWGSPTSDLNYFFYTSLCLADWQTQRYELLLHYYEIFKTMLTSFEYKEIPTWNDLLKEMKRGALLGFYVVACEFPICVMSDEAAEDLTAAKLLESQDKWSKVFETQKVKDFIRHAALHFQEMGLFDEYEKL